MPKVYIENVDSLLRTINKFPKELQQDLRDGSVEDAQKIVIPALRQSAYNSPTPIARSLVQAARPRRDRLGAKVRIGGSGSYTRSGAPLYEVIMGSEHGGKTFGAAAGGKYWAEPAVRLVGGKVARSTQDRVADVINYKWRF